MYQNLQISFCNSFSKSPFFGQLFFVHFERNSECCNLLVSKALATHCTEVKTDNPLNESYVVNFITALTYQNDGTL